MPTEVVKTKEFRKHMDVTLSELFDHMEHNDYDEKFDLHIEWNGKRIQLDMHADLYMRFEQFINETIEEEEL